MLERRKSVFYFLGNFLLVFLILASSFNYTLVAEVLCGGRGWGEEYQLATWPFHVFEGDQT